MGNFRYHFRLKSPMFPPGFNDLQAFASMFNSVARKNRANPPEAFARAKPLTVNAQKFRE
jgi:hypothetical protein